MMVEKKVATTHPHALELISERKFLGRLTGVLSIYSGSMVAFGVYLEHEHLVSNRKLAALIFAGVTAANLLTTSLPLRKSLNISRTLKAHEPKTVAQLPVKVKDPKTELNLSRGTWEGLRIILRTAGYATLTVSISTGIVIASAIANHVSSTDPKTAVDAAAFGMALFWTRPLFSGAKHISELLRI